MVSSNASTNFFRVNGADALHHAAAEVFLDALSDGGRGAGEHLRPELLAELPVLDPAALGIDPFAGADRGQRSNHADQITVALGLGLEHREAVFLIEEGNALDQAGQAFRMRGRWRWRQHSDIVRLACGSGKSH